MPKKPAASIYERATRLALSEGGGVPEALLDQVGDLLGVGVNKRLELAGRLRRIATAYLNDKAYFQDWLVLPKKGKSLSQAMSNALSEALLAIGRVPPEYLPVIETLANRLPAAGATTSFELQALRHDIARLRDGTADFLANYHPKEGRPPNVALEEAVRALTALIEPQTGGHPIVTQNKNKSEGSTLVSVEARAIGMLLRGIDPTLTTTAIVNMIEKIDRQPRPSEDPLTAIFEADPEAKLDASLLGRHTRNKQVDPPTT